MELTNKCGYYEVARNQRDILVARSLGKKGIEGFIKMGCYDKCDGYNTKCPAYFSPKQLYEKGFEGGEE